MSGLLDLLAQNFPSLFGAPAPARPRSLLDTTDTNPVGTSSIYPPQVLTNPDPNVSPVVDKSTLTPQAAWGVLLQGKRGQPVTAAELPAAEDRANTMVDYGMAVAGATQPIRAFHGSPHTFDRFDLSKIGTGEGAQAYGHGLYFADNEAVAKSYRDALQQKPTVVYNHPAYDGKSVVLRGNEVLSVHNTAAAANRALAKVPGGSMYEVNLRTSPERLLDWDKPLRDQPKHVQEALADFGNTPGDYARAIELWRQPTTGARKWVADDAIKQLEREMYGAGSRTGGEWYGRAGQPTYGGESYPKLAGQLRDAGLDGIQYLDAGSRGVGEGTRNYVLFRDDIIDILRRYGLLGMVGGGAGAGLLGAPEQ